MAEISCKNIDDTQWDEYAERHPDANIYHLSGWRKAAQISYGTQDRSLIAKENNRVVGLLPLVKIKKFNAASYLTSGIFGSYNGILADNARIREELLAHACSLCRREGHGFMVIKDHAARDHHGFVSYLGYFIFTLSLSADVDKVWLSLKDKTRNQIRKARRSGLSAGICNDGLGAFCDIYARNMRDMGTPFLGSGFLKEVMKYFRGRADIFLVKLKDKAVGGGLVMRFKKTAYLPFASTLRKFNVYCPNNILYWEAISSACERGERIFDLGRSTVGTGGFNFKKQWTHESPRQLCYYYFPKEAGVESFNPNEEKYRRYAALWRMLPLKAANALGPRVIKYFL